ncbi:hypothetical protein J6590_026525 [Homalodisca vitripennis]|nr:hypothetical protein J6590_026525 [Homalodisca vitripennis]
MYRQPLAEQCLEYSKERGALVLLSSGILPQILKRSLAVELGLYLTVKSFYNKTTIDTLRLDGLLGNKYNRGRDLIEVGTCQIPLEPVIHNSWTGRGQGVPKAVVAVARDLPKAGTCHKSWTSRGQGVPKAVVAVTRDLPKAGSCHKSWTARGQVVPKAVVAVTRDLPKAGTCRKSWTARGHGFQRPWLLKPRTC